MRNLQRGFTLIELMTGILIVAILMAIAVPSFKSFTAKSNVTAATNQLVTGLNYARSEAVRRAQPVTVCPSSDGATCDASANWSTGWIVFTDSVSPFGSVDTGDTLLQVFPAVPPTLSVTETDANGNYFLRYDSRGMKIIHDPYSFAVLSPRACTGNQQARVDVAAIGTLQSSYVACP